MWKTSFQTEWHFKTIPLFWFFSKSLGRLLERRCIECCSKPLITNYHSTTPTKPSIDTGVRPLGSDSYHERDAFFRSHLSSLPFRLIQLSQTVKLPWAPKPPILTVKQPRSLQSQLGTPYTPYSHFERLRNPARDNFTPDSSTENSKRLQNPKYDILTAQRASPHVRQEKL